MRYFLAIPLPEEIKQELHQLNTEFSKYKGLRFVNPDNMHLTLLFLGNSNVNEKIKELKKLKFKAFKLKTKKISAFPEKGKIRLLWVDLKKSQELEDLQKKISKLFNIKKEYRPHITLARIKKIEKDEKDRIIKKVNEIKHNELTITVKNFKLYSSELTVLGPVHRVIEYFSSSESEKTKIKSTGQIRA
jgi:2'-5' RNA ligase